MRQAMGQRAGLALAALATLTGTLALAAAPAAAQEAGAPSPAEMERAQQLYQAHCGRCHGVLGLGGEGPGLTFPRLPRAPDHASLVNVIRRGISGTGMPGMRATVLPDAEAALVASYVLSLREAAVADVPGDAQRGRQVFETSGDCYSCHIVAGRGTGVGPELSGIGMRRGADYLRAALVDPAADLPVYRSGARNGFARYLPVRVVTQDGDVYQGMRANEDAFTIQLILSSGSLVSLRKSELTELGKRFGHSLMPATGDFSGTDIDDLVAYLASLGGGS